VNKAGDVDAGFTSNSGTKYTTGGQIGAPNETGCCPDGPDGTHGPSANCPFGDWEHNHHSGPDDGYITGGAFAFHSGTAASPPEAFISGIVCQDPGWCVQARPAPDKQIFWEGTGVFHNLKNKHGKDLPLPVFPNCTVVPFNDKADVPTIHYYKAHVGDFGEPAGQRQKTVTASCKTQGDNFADWSITPDTCEVSGEEDFTPVSPNAKLTALHPLCPAEACGCDPADTTCTTSKAGCPDWYDIEIHCTSDPTSPIIYSVAHYVLQGNFQLHPPVSSNCNTANTCGDGTCNPADGEDCTTCPADCGTCP
jgi:hypothetical protein